MIRAGSELAFDRTTIQRDAIDAVCWCEHVLPQYAGLTLYVAIQVNEQSPLRLGAVVSDSLSTTKLSGPVVDEAKRALQSLGYTLKWRVNVDIAGLVEVSAGRISKHRRMAAIARIKEALK